MAHLALMSTVEIAGYVDRRMCNFVSLAIVSFHQGLYAFS